MGTAWCSGCSGCSGRTGWLGTSRRPGRRTDSHSRCGPGNDPATGESTWLGPAAQRRTSSSTGRSAAWWLAASVLINNGAFGPLDFSHDYIYKRISQPFNPD
jgi:hypothetical protein